MPTITVDSCKYHCCRTFCMSCERDLVPKVAGSKSIFRVCNLQCVPYCFSKNPVWVRAKTTVVTTVATINSSFLLQQYRGGEIIKILHLTVSKTFHIINYLSSITNVIHGKGLLHRCSYTLTCDRSPFRSDKRNREPFCHSCHECEIKFNTYTV